MPYINYVELNTGDHRATATFFKEVFGWDPQPWGADDYLVASHGDEPGVDAGITVAEDGEPVTVAVVTVDDLEGTMARVIIAGGEIVVPKFSIPGVGHACYVTDPTGLIVGLHQSDPETT